MVKQTFNIKLAEEKLKVEFKNKNLLKLAFTHSSFAHENKTSSNERLEFLGDSVLGFIVTEQIYEIKKFDEGELSKLRSLLVSEKPLAKIIDKLGVEPLMLKGIGEQKNKFVSPATKCDLFEAIVGAIYLDSGLNRAKDFVLNALKGEFESVMNLKTFEDAKTHLQEMIPNKEIVYDISKEETDEIYYIATVKINGVACGKGRATSKKSAEQEAAAQAIKNLKNK